jgi:hypothetical protein
LLESGTAGSQINGPDRVNTPVKSSYTGQPQPALALDPGRWMDQIHLFKLNRAVLLKSPRVFPVSQKYPSTLGKSLQSSPVFFS